MKSFFKLTVLTCLVLVLGMGLLQGTYPEFVTNPWLHGLHVVSGIVLLILLACLISHNPTPDRFKEPTKAEMQHTSARIYTDQARLDFLEEEMCKCVVSVTGQYATPFFVPNIPGDYREKFVNVHFNGIGIVGRGTSFRDAIDNAYETSLTMNTVGSASKGLISEPRPL